MRRTVLALCFVIVSLAIGFGASPLDERAIPSPKQWNGTEPAPKPEFLPSLRARWTAVLDVPASEVALTDSVAVVSSCSRERGTCQLKAFDLATGKPTRSTEWRRAAAESDTPAVYSQSSDTFVVADRGVLTEYGSDLKQRLQLKLPPGMRLTPTPGYGYSDWLRVTNIECNSVNLFAVGDRKLVVGCGGMGVLDSDWRLLFAESYTKPHSLGWPAISQDGTRFVLPLRLDYVEPPLHTSIGIVLYDLRGKSAREFVFRANDEQYNPALPSLSPDGKRMALLRHNRLIVYDLPN